MGVLADRIFGRFQQEGSGAGTAVPLIMPGRLDERRAKIIRQWTYYNGRDPVSGKSQWDYLYERFETMPRREIEDIENHIRIAADRLRRLLVNSWRGLEFDDPETGAAVSAIFDRNHWPRLLNLAVLYGQVSGDAFIRLVKAPEKSQYAPVRMVLLDSEAVEVEVDPHDRDEIKSLTVAYDYFDRDSSGKTVKRAYRELIDRESVTTFIDGEYSPEKSYVHGLGFIPVVHVRNLDMGGAIYGESLVERLLDAQDAINMLACDLMDIVRYDGHKTTIFQNVHIDRGASRDGTTSGEIDLSIGKGLAVRGDGKVYKLDQQHDLGAALEEYERKLDAFYGLAGVPRLSRDLVSGLGSLSGRAIERLYQDAIDSTREAQLIYGDAIRELAEKVTLMSGNELSKVRTLWNSDVINPDVDTLSKEYNLGARSLKSVMRKLGIADVEGMLQERREEASASVDAL